MLQEFFDAWYERYRQASIATTDRAEQIAEVAKEVEVRGSRLPTRQIDGKIAQCLVDG